MGLSLSKYGKIIRFQYKILYPLKKYKILLFVYEWYDGLV
jgi:hypothetical protein